VQQQLCRIVCAFQTQLLGRLELMKQHVPGF
jgi:hypothetical protein